jgi:L,D-peptidoglycan transpeptidase YkuD (ErfK/YbiS/YcfS/YnhG family)
MKLTVIMTAWGATQGILLADGRRFECTLGRNGMALPPDKKEGDGKTPIGIFPLRQLLYRADRVPKPITGLPIEILTKETGWCEDPAHPDYNKKITLPHPAVHDRMTREDHLYDYVVVIGYNDAPPVAGKGSAIFMHLARPDFTPTAGCVGLRAEDILEVLKHCDTFSKIDIRLPV